ncbi:unnamed protein product [Toxocara canis]|uniref:Pre-mRNA-splicing factor SPF27 n=1 Tax=Toxocara canis TaxID=6265 RepID=A0A183VGU1_TOXCA|nr:unnamed protein product [Toxocara canis]
MTSEQQSSSLLALPPASASDCRALAENENDAGVLVDALPYLDTDYTEADHQMALQLIENECRMFRPTKNYLKFLPAPDLDAFLTPCMIKEHARMAKKQEMPKLDMSRCELSCPSTTGRQGDKTSWRKEMPKLDMSRCELSCPSTTGRQGDKTSWRKVSLVFFLQQTLVRGGQTDYLWRRMLP